MNILVTGGLGYIGSRVVQYFLDIGHIVTILDNLESAISLDIEDASIINIDMTDEGLKNILELLKLQNFFYSRDAEILYSIFLVLNPI